MRRRGRQNTWTATWLHHRGIASIDSATWLRQKLDSWTRAAGVPTDLAYDLVLSCYEAMANVVTHAYPTGTTGFLDLRARLHKNDINVTVSDCGRWKPETDHSEGGRGLDLIRHLSDDVDVLHDDHGTRIDMHWRRPDTQ
jgi:anti-sigma regulatory factor (Ser/Thr protein kinase)